MIRILQKYLRPGEYQQERRQEAELAYRAQVRSFRRYSASLQATAERFRRMAVDAEHQGRHANALRAARFTRLLDSTLDKVDSVQQHLEMLHAVSDAGNIMVEFMDACKRTGCSLTETIDLDGLSASELGLEQGLNRLNFLSDKLEQAFETMDLALDAGCGDMSTDPEDERILSELCGLSAAGPDLPAEPAPESPELPEEPAPELPDSIRRAIEDTSSRLEALAH